MKIRVAVTIDAAPDVVWRVIEPLEHHVDWMGDAVWIRFTSETTRGVGTTFDSLTRVGPLRVVDRLTVTEWEPGRAMAIEHRGAVTGCGRFTLRRRRGDRTRFVWTEQLRFPWWMGGRAGALTAKPVLRAIWRRNLRRLKAIVEAT